jgi:hypothetical protein
MAIRGLAACRGALSALALPLVLALGASGCSDGGSGSSASAAPVVSSTNSASRTGTIDLLTYNVAGLPDFLSGSQPARNTPIMSPLLNAYQLVLVQEDFWYHDDLVSATTHPHRSTPMSGQSRMMNDGLNQFSAFPITVPVERYTWSTCHGLWDHGSDCLAAKGFTYSRIEVEPGVEIDVYNLHNDAGSAYEDRFARDQQMIQLRDFILARSAGRPLIVAGDTNLKASRPDDERVLQSFMNSLGLLESCRTLTCPRDSIDRVLLRGTADVTLAPVMWRDASEFVDAAGNELSDHRAVHVLIEWTTP